MIHILLHDMDTHIADFSDVFFTVDHLHEHRVMNIAQLESGGLLGNVEPVEYM